MELKKNLKKLMSENDMRVPQLSRATKVPSTTIYNWLAGQKPKDIDQVKIISEYFQTSLDSLCYGVKNIDSNLLESKQEEINAGIFEVVLRKVKNN